MKVFSFWFDFENAPDVLFFEPIIKQLRRSNYNVYITCRNYYNVPELVKIYGLKGETVGRYGGKAKISKYTIGILRSLQLAFWSLNKNINLAIGFGSRPLSLTCKILRIPNVSVIDYEHVSVLELNKFCNFIYIPEIVSIEYFIKKGINKKKLRTFPGLKEEVYVNSYTYTSKRNSSNKKIKKLKNSKSKINLVIRPPASTAHYHNERSEVILKEILERIRNKKNVNAFLLARSDDNTYDAYINGNINILEKPVKGLDLIRESDVVISGGGTMVREAAALGVPSYSIFTGELGAVDKKLAEEGKINLIRDLKDIDKIRFEKCKERRIKEKEDTTTLDFFVNEFIKLARKFK